VTTTLSSRIIRPLGSTLGFVNDLEGLFRWLLFNRLPAGVTETVLPTVPALKNVITAQASGEPGIRGGGRFVPSVSRALTHACSQRYTGDRGCSWRREVPRARKSPGHACVPPGTHMPLRLPTRGNPHTDAKPTAPHHTPAASDTADRSTAWMWSAVPDTTEWRRPVGLGIPHRGKTCAAGKCSASLQHVASREHDGRMAGREASAAVILG
jgi:hypothetical protein